MIRYLHTFCLTVQLIGMYISMKGQPAHFQAPQDSANPWTHLEFYDDPQNFKFAIVSDRTGGLRPGIFDEAVKKLNLLMPEFVMSVGDFIPGVTTDKEQLNAEWTEFDSILAPLKVPFFYLPGNHDISNDIMRAYWNKKFGRAYYHFTYKNVLFIALDSNPESAETINTEQINYVQEVLSQHQEVRWTMLFLHHPLWLYGEYAGGFPQIEQLLSDRPHTVIAGHTHRYLYQKRNDINYYVLATTGGGSGLRGPRFGEFDHVTLVTMTDEGPRLVNLRLEGILPHDITTQADYDLTQHLVESTQLKPLVLSTSNDRFEKGSVYLTLNNPGEDTLHIYGRYFHHHYLTLDTTEIKLTLAPQETSQIHTTVISDKSLAFEMLDPLKFDWTMGYEWPDKEDLVLSGSTDILLFPSQLNLIHTPDPIFTDSLQVILNEPDSFLELRYTTDGTDPTLSSPIYTQPFHIHQSTELNVSAFNQQGERTAIDSHTYEKVTAQTGINYSYYEGNWRKLPDFSTLTPKHQGLTDNFQVGSLAQRKDHFALKYTGTIKIQRAGTYTFYTTSDDGSQLLINDTLVVDNDGDHGPMTKSGTIYLNKGQHPLTITYFENIGGELLEVEWQSTDEEKQPISFDFLSRE